MKPVFSIVVPLKKVNDYLRREIIPALKKQNFQDFELLIVPDRKTEGEKFPFFARIIPSWPKLGPADKKDLGAEKAKGEFIAFLDDDAYPDKNWLKKAIPLFKDKSIAAVCGPGATPANDSFLAQVSGWLWSSWLGAGGAGTYRCWPGKKREVDDYPSFNLIVRKKDFQTVGGFDSGFWPGEDTKLCHDLVYKLGKKIIYDPEVLAYHHRREILIPHLKQIGRYGLHRGHFAKILPKTSKRLGYFIPPLFTAGVFLGPIVYWFLKVLNFDLLARLAIGFYFLSLISYFLLALATSLWIWLKSKSFLIALLFIPTVFLSHVFYGMMFFKGIFKKRVKSKYRREKI